MAVSLLVSCGGGDANRGGPGAGIRSFGLEHRTLATAWSSERRGALWLQELACANCHGDVPAERRAGPVLREVASQLRASYLERFLADPHAVRPGTAMPDVLGARSDGERGDVARALAAYLRSMASTARALEAEPSADSISRGRELYRSVGCVACHAPRSAAGGEMDVVAAHSLAGVREKYTRAGLTSFLLDPLAARPGGRMPDMQLSPDEAHDLTSFLLGGEDSGADKSAAREESRAVEEALVNRGRDAFVELRCASCHEQKDPKRIDRPVDVPKLAGGTAGAAGCLSDSPGSWPRFSADAQQREDMLAALRSASVAPTGVAAIELALVSRNCVACHQRGELGGVLEDRERFFTTSDPAVGHEGRFPPSLSGVGSKLQQEWMHDVIAHGQRVRPYLKTRMPGFGSAFATRLGVLFEAEDKVEERAMTPLPKDRKEARKITDLGRELVGEKGMNCISCHLFAGQRLDTMGALDLVAWTEKRLRPGWFERYLRDPFAFKPNTLMPQFYPDGKSIRPEMAGGDPARQIEAMWHYLSRGRNVRKPPGLRRKKIEVQGMHEAVLLRRSLQDSSKRAISVAFPRRDGSADGLNLGFDAESLCLEQLWWGRFIDAAPVWTGQGSGRARILGERRAVLVRGPGFARLASPEAAWPANRRELGQRWLGYDLDSERRPQLRYALGDGTEVVDVVREARDDDGAEFLRRELRIASPADVKTGDVKTGDAKPADAKPGLYFRAGLSKKQQIALSERGYAVGPVEVRIVSGARAFTHQSEKGTELRLEVDRKAAEASGVVLEYRWLGDQKRKGK